MRFGFSPESRRSFLIGRLQFDYWQQWTEWFSGTYNWKNFDLIEIGYEFEPYCEGHELQLSLLGFGLRTTYWYGKGYTEAPK